MRHQARADTFSCLYATNQHQFGQRILHFASPFMEIPAESLAYPPILGLSRRLMFGLEMGVAESIYTKSNRMSSQMTS